MHHRDRILDKAGAVVRATKRTGYAVGQLVLDDVGSEAETLMQNRARHCAKTMAGDLRFRVVTESLKRGIDSRTAHRFFAVAAREYIAPLAGGRLQLSQHLDCLRGKRHQMLGLRLGNGIAPLAPLEVNFRSFGPPQLARSHEQQWR